MLSRTFFFECNKTKGSHSNFSIFSNSLQGLPISSVSPDYISFFNFSQPSKSFSSTNFTNLGTITVTISDFGMNLKNFGSIWTICKSSQFSRKPSVIFSTFSLTIKVSTLFEKKKSSELMFVIFYGTSKKVLNFFSFPDKYLISFNFLQFLNRNSSNNS